MKFLYALYAKLSFKMQISGTIQVYGFEVSAIISHLAKSFGISVEEAEVIVIEAIRPAVPVISLKDLCLPLIEYSSEISAKVFCIPNNKTSPKISSNNLYMSRHKSFGKKLGKDFYRLRQKI